ncbi:MAG: hypothetical protein M3Z84_00220, partial [Actinomycetota bacterium]|nr:hypothetical protein [Actinomycetota bacterium]
MRQRDVPTIMDRVGAALTAAEGFLEGATGVISLESEGDVEVDVARVRQLADIDLGFQSGSDRPGLGPAIRMAKRLIRRSMRWYLEPVVRQQSQFNNASLDLTESLRLRISGASKAPAASRSLTTASRALGLERWRQQFVGCDHVLDLGAQTLSPAQQPQGLSWKSIDAVFIPHDLLKGPSDLVALLDTVAAALETGGLIVVETAVGTDRSPNQLHPEVVALALEACGFADVRAESPARVPFVESSS